MVTKFQKKNGKNFYNYYHNMQPKVNAGKQIYNLPYTISIDWVIVSDERTVTYNNRWWTQTTYTKKSYTLKYDWKYSESGHKLARVTLYDPESQTNKSYYVAKLLYSVYNNIEYNKVRNIHYRDNDTTNITLSNIYSTWTAKQSQTL